uniref:Uncharacterized protein n=1 Tax=Steinernema glaseri TaxID=37863 RepID=A0A1I7Y245_9BILA
MGAHVKVFFEERGYDSKERRTDQEGSLMHIARNSARNDAYSTPDDMEQVWYLLSTKGLGKTLGQSSPRIVAVTARYREQTYTYYNSETYP